jgi:hypothetical protein
MVICPFQESDEADMIALWTDVFGDNTAHNDPATVIRHKLAVQSGSPRRSSV